MHLRVIDYRNTFSVNFFREPVCTFLLAFLVFARSERRVKSSRREISNTRSVEHNERKSDSVWAGL